MDTYHQAIIAMRRLRITGVAFLLFGLAMLVPVHLINWLPAITAELPMIGGIGLIIASIIGRFEADYYKNR